MENASTVAKASVRWKNLVAVLVAVILYAVLRRYVLLSLVGEMASYFVGLLPGLWLFVAFVFPIRSPSGVPKWVFNGLVATVWAAVMTALHVLVSDSSSR